MKVLSYILILPAAVAGILLSFFIVPEILNVRALLFCPDGFREGMDCYFSGWETYPDWATNLFAMLAACFSILLSTMIAPSHKLTYSIGIYILGASLAIYVGVYASSKVPMAYALFAGFICLVLVWHLTRTKSTPAAGRS